MHERNHSVAIQGSFTESTWQKKILLIDKVMSFTLLNKKVGASIALAVWFIFVENFLCLFVFLYLLWPNPYLIYVYRLVQFA